MIELTCTRCQHPHTATRADILRMPPAMYRRCAECRNTDAPPVAPCTVTWSERGAFWSVVVPRCPLCGKRHSHGGGSATEPDLGHRQSHCLDRPGSYELAETPESVQARRRRAKELAA